MIHNPFTKFKINLPFRKRFLFIGIGVFVVVAGLSWYFFSTNAKAQLSPEATPEPTPSLLDDRAIPEAPADLELPEPTATTKDVSTAETINILLLGYGGAGHQGGFLTDVILLAQIDFTHKRFGLIHIPRDVWVTLPSGTGDFSTKINAALPLGLKQGNYPTEDVAKDTIIRGSYLVKQSVSQVTGITPDFVVTVDFARFSQAINALRGIDVNVLKTLNDPWYPITGRELELCGKTPEEVTELSNTLSGFELEKQFPCRYEELNFTPGITHMDGDTVLKFVRSRHTTSDFDRGERQIQVIEAIVAKLFELDALNHQAEFYATLTKAVKTDVTVDHLAAVAPRLTSLLQFTTAKISLSTANVLVSTKTSSGAFALLSKGGEDNWQTVQQYIASQLSK